MLSGRIMQEIDDSVAERRGFELSVPVNSGASDRFLPEFFGSLRAPIGADEPVSQPTCTVPARSFYVALQGKRPDDTTVDYEYGCGTIFGQNQLTSCFYTMPKKKTCSLTGQNQSVVINEWISDQARATVQIACEIYKQLF